MKKEAHAYCVEVQQCLPARTRHQRQCQKSLGELLWRDKDIGGIGCPDLLELLEICA